MVVLKLDVAGRDDPIASRPDVDGVSVHERLERQIDFDVVADLVEDAATLTVETTNDLSVTKPLVSRSRARESKTVEVVREIEAEPAAGRGRCQLVRQLDERIASVESAARTVVHVLTRAS